MPYTITGNSTLPDANVIEFIVCENDDDIVINIGTVNDFKSIDAMGNGAVTLGSFTVQNDLGNGRRRPRPPVYSAPHARRAGPAAG